MANITSIGAGSGIDLEGLLEQLVAAERAPTENRLNLQEAEAQASISAFGSLKSTLSAFQDALSNLKDNDFFDSRSATSGDSSLFTATADPGADLATYTIDVADLAEANKVATAGAFADPSATVGEGTLTIGFLGGSSFDISVALTDDLTTIRDAINNSTTNVGVTASLLTVDAGMGDGSTITELVLTSNASGDDNQLDISVVDTGDGDHTDNLGLSRFHYDGSDPDNSGAGLNQLTQIDAAQDASIIVDGFTVFSSSNQFSDVISGVTITALADDGGVVPAPSAALVIGTDKTSVKSNIETVLASYNELMAVLNELTNYDAATNTRGLLGADVTVSSLERQIRSAFTDPVEGADANLNGLAILGVTTNQDGTITLDEAALDDAINDQFDNFAALFSSTDGIATRVDAVLENYISFGGIFDTRDEGFKAQLSEIEDQRATLELRIEKIEARFRAQFAALDILISQLNSTGDFLLQQLEATAQIINRDNG